MVELVDYRDLQVKWLWCTQDVGHKLEILLQAMIRIRSGAKLFSNDVFAPKWLILPEICLYYLNANLWWPYLQYLLCNSLIQKVLVSVQGFSLLSRVLCKALIWTQMGSLNYSLHLPTLKMWSWPPSTQKPSLVPTAGFFFYCCIPYRQCHLVASDLARCFIHILNFKSPYEAV